MNEENECNHVTGVDMVNGIIERITRKEMVKVIRKMKPGKAAGVSEVNMENVNCELYNRALSYNGTLPS